MTLRDRLRALDRLQQARTFKVIASVLVTLAAVGGIVAIGVALKASGQPDLAPAATDAAGTAIDQTSRILRDVVSARTSLGSSAAMIGIAWGLCLVVIWLGLSLTYLGLGVACALPLWGVWLTGIGRDAIPMIAGLGVLAGSFIALMRGAMLLMNLPGPVFAIARNVLAESTRMRLSAVFIILLIFMMAALPTLLDSEQPLRYRMQAFLQYGTGGAFWLIAVLTLLFSCATVAFEQRDKIIWQTMTKPVRAWEYLLGKWLGVVTLGAVLLGVCASGIFMFAEHLRGQPAVGERAAYVAVEERGVAEDRFLLETQVLAARVQVDPDPLPLDDEQFRKNVNARAETFINEVLGNMTPGPERRVREAELRAEIERSLGRAVQDEYRAIEPGRREFYRFSGLGSARNSTRPLFFRFKVNAGSNPPDQTYKVSFQFGGTAPEVREVGLGQTQTLPILPGVIDEDGNAKLVIVNGDAGTMIANPETISFPPDGLSLSYSDGTFGANFARVVGALWIKLAFLAMVGVFCSTFMSFPVACLCAFTIFFAAEGSTFLLASLENFWTEDREGKTLYFNTAVSWVATGIGNAFTVYGDLRPTARLVEGLKLSFSTMALGAGVLLAWTLILFGAGVGIFRRRELATYSGN